MSVTNSHCTKNDKALTLVNVVVALLVVVAAVVAARLVVAAGAGNSLLDEIHDDDRLEYLQVEQSKV